MTKPLCALILAGAAALAIVEAQTSPQFEAASIKRNPSGEDLRAGVRYMGTQVSAQNVPVAALISSAYGVPIRDLIGPAWIFDEARERYDVTARAADGSSRQDQQAMLRHMLETRFALRLHRETREVPVYLLQKLNEQGGLGPNLRSAAKSCPPSPSCEGRTGGAGSFYKGAEWPFVFRLIEGGVPDRRVIDRTSLKGAFDFELQYGQGLAALDGGAIDIFIAVRQQLGLKLEGARAPFEMTVIDAVSRPTPD